MSQENNFESRTDEVKPGWFIFGTLFFIGLAVFHVYIAFRILTGDVPVSGRDDVAAVSTTKSFGDDFPALAVLPDIPFPLDNPYSDEKYELGKMLFFDTRMSGDGSFSCNSCHPASDGSWAVSSPISFGYPGSTHWRNSSTLINNAYFRHLNWDAGKTSAEKQAKGAWGGAVAGNVDSAMAEERLTQIPVYVQMFKDAFGYEYPTWGHALNAVATFERTIVSQNVPFDTFLQGNDLAITEQAKRGYTLFMDKARCIGCHNGALISDDTMHNIGVPTYEGFFTNSLHQITFRYEQWSKGVTEEDYNTADKDFGYYYVTKLEEDKGKFRTPGLRDVCYTAPYMHNGVFSALEEVIDFYDAGGGTTRTRIQSSDP